VRFRVKYAMAEAPSRTSHPAVTGAAWAVLAALSFGASTPLVQKAGSGLGPLTTAGLLYLGATIVGLLSRRPSREAALRRSDWPRLGAMAFFGAVLGPVALAWGLQRTTGTGASLMLTLEAVFTAVLARWLYKETMDARVWTAMGLLALGGGALILDQGLAGGASVVGLLAVLSATAFWGTDNTLSRALADRDPGDVVLAKCALGSMCTGILAVVLREPLPSPATAAILLAIGATGYGLSLRFYLLAQRAFGAARTGSVFAFAPFIGALVAIAMGDRSGTWLIAGGSVLMVAGVALHLMEKHEHLHEHESMAHEHAHDHDDGHHDHIHDPMPLGSHSHPHVHRSMEHSHPHVPDLHHQHEHKS
jgi:drug/metabolite transporter (DMT)-like permease